MRGHEREAANVLRAGALWYAQRYNHDAEWRVCFGRHGLRKQGEMPLRAERRGDACWALKASSPQWWLTVTFSKQTPP
jgi:hypothetical protein